MNGLHDIAVYERAVVFVQEKRLGRWLGLLLGDEGESGRLGAIYL